MVGTRSGHAVEDFGITVAVLRAWRLKRDLYAWEGFGDMTCAISRPEFPNRLWRQMKIECGSSIGLDPRLFWDA
jgi:hypothetical protein